MTVSAAPRKKSVLTQFGYIEVSDISCQIFFFFFLPTLLLLPSPKNSLTHQSIFFPKSNLWKIEEEKGAWSKNQKMNWLIFLDDFLQLAWMLSDPSHNQNGCFNTRCLKITEKISFKIASEASYVYILSWQKLIRNAKNGQFGEFLKNATF